MSNLNDYIKIIISFLRFVLKVFRHNLVDVVVAPQERTT